VYFAYPKWKWVSALGIKTLEWVLPGRERIKFDERDGHTPADGKDRAFTHSVAR